MKTRECFIFLGPPGAGKGTQAKLFCSDRGLAHVSTGDMLRAAMSEGTDLGRMVKGIVDSGKLVSDDVMIRLIKERIKKDDCERGFVLDGFPRTIPQALALEALESQGLLTLVAVALFDISTAALLSRLSARRSTEGRADDSEDTQLERLNIYQENTAPLIDHFSNKGLLKRIPSDGTVENVSQELFAQLR